VFRKGPSFFADWRSPDGRHRKAFPTKQRALDHENAQQRIAVAARKKTQAPATKPRRK
jgi:hypothetical protein